MKRRKLLNLCECGCGEIVKGVLSKFKPGHHIRTIVNPMRIPEIKAKCFTKEHNANIAKSKKGKPSPLKGRTGFYSEETLKRIGANTRKRLADKSNHHYFSKKRSAEDCEAISRGRRGKYMGKDNHFSNAEKYSRGKANGMYEKKQSKEMIEKALGKRLESQKIKPNMLENTFLEFLQALFPDEYKYVGDFQLVIGGKCPDFVNCNGQKKVIELFGNYWHSEELLGIPEEKSEQERIEHFKEYGWDCLIIWENEFKNNSDMVRQKTINFNRRRWLKF